MAKPVVLFRHDPDWVAEYRAAALHLERVWLYRSQVEPGSLVIGRYSVEPFYADLEAELALSGSRLINSLAQHRWITDLLPWADPHGGLLQGLTPPAWTEWGSLPEGAYVVKGRTYSRKHQWQTHMFAPTRAAIADIARRLYDDPLVSQAGLVVRPYVALAPLGEGINGLPISNEWRTFWLATKAGPVCLGRGFYWTSYPELAAQARWTEEAASLVQAAALRVAQRVPFFVLDVAETRRGDWTVIEVNDGQMSGLCGVEPDGFYANLARQLAVGVAPELEEG
jgi:hypothetical protein